MSALDTLRSQFADPPREFGMMPQWFWNDDLDEAELLRQLREFHAKGCGGVMPHARVGLSRRVGYLTPEFFRLVRLVVTEAARLGLKVVLYDEGSYPSGSAQGQVVAENPAWANRVLLPLWHRLSGPARGFWRSNRSRYLGDRLIGAVAGRETAANHLAPDSLRVLSSPDGELVHYDLPAGDWVLVATWNVLSGATLRGVFEEEDDEHALAPAAADILNPAAVASFIRHTHERYREAIGDAFGSTVIGIFIDEPGLCGRGPRRGGAQAKPYTEGFLDDLQPLWDDDVQRWLPALWLDCGPRTADFRAAYEQALQERQRRVFYGPISAWCTRHGLALTGHPPRSDECRAQRLFHWPGQDMVWWYVAPGNAQAMGGKPRTALEGEHSTAPKGAHSMALLDCRRCTTVEVLGAYGWHLTLDAVKWLLDWHFVRGINLFFPHACFYSIRGRRAYESEPDLGVHNVWWPYWGLVADYVRRLCWLCTDAEELCEAAILCDPEHLPWQAAKVLYENQVPFLYVGSDTVREAVLDGGQLCLGRAGVRVSTLVVDPAGSVDPEAQAAVAAFTAAGGTVIAAWTPASLPNLLRRDLGEVPRWEGPPDLRLRLWRRQETTFAMVVNEGEAAIAGTLRLPAERHIELWDPLTGQATPVAVEPSAGGVQVPLRLERREGLVLAATRGAVAGPTPAVFSPRPWSAAAGESLLEIAGPWLVTNASGERVAIPAPGNWAQETGFELFAGTLVYRTRLNVTAAQAAATRQVDLGRVGDIAEVWVNGRCLGVRAWAPYLVPSGKALQAGANDLEIRVTNSMANPYYGQQLPSGLIGPVSLRA